MGSRVASTIRRALLYVPASSTKFLEKSRTIPTIDNVTYDLEDSVTPDRKPEARKALRRFLEQVKPDNVREVAVRINSVDSGHALEDLREVVSQSCLSIRIVAITEPAHCSSKPQTSMRL